MYPKYSDTAHGEQFFDQMKTNNVIHNLFYVIGMNLNRSRRSVRSGYAFAHQEGFGRLITSGKIMRSNPLPVQPRSNRPTGHTVSPASPAVPPHQVSTGHMPSSSNLSFPPEDSDAPSMAAAAAAAGLLSSTINKVAANDVSSGGRKRKNNHETTGNNIVLTNVLPQPV